MERPEVICHIFATMDGRIDGAFMGAPAAVPARGAYARLQVGYGADAVVYGATTLCGFIGAAAPRLRAGASAPAGDFVARHGEGSYLVAVDPKGSLAWESGTFRRPGRDDAHVIALLSGAASPAYCSYLRERGVSYVTAGEAELDLSVAVARLGELFGVRRLLVCGGGVTDVAFLAAGALDELSVVVAPVASGERGVATVFDESAFAALEGPVAFSLVSAERVDGDGLHVVWRRRDA